MKMKAYIEAMTKTVKHTLNELLVNLFNYILFIEETNLKKQGVELGIGEIHLLESIEKTADNTMTNIARRSMITQGTLTTNIKRLERMGYVLRTKDSRDGRVTRLSLTEKGRQVLAIHDRFHEEMIDSIIDELNLGEDQLLITSLEHVMRYFRNTYAADTDSQLI